MSRFAGQNLCCVRGDRMVFRGLGFALEPGGALLLTGPNGSGKSSLLRLMAGLLPAAAGTLAWDGTPVAKDRANLFGQFCCASITDSNVVNGELF